MWRKLFLTNIGWKLMSLALAFLIWLLVQGVSNDSSTQTERTFTDLPAQLVSGPTDVRTFRLNPDVVQVTVKGPPGIIKALTEREIRVFVDGSITDPTRNFRQRVEVATPTRLTVVRVEPAEVEIIVPPRPATTSPRSKP